MIKRALPLICALLLLWGETAAQERYFTKNGHISFFSKAPLEDIEAHNEQVVSFIDLETGEIVFSVPMKAFKFRKSLMQQHFNENYIESDKYPKATFKGRVTNMHNLQFDTNGINKVQVEGELTIHGVTNSVSTTGTLETSGEQLKGITSFSVSPKDYNIEIPLLVREHIAKRVDITVNMLYVPYTGKAL